ncbi:MAG: hypothetical protein LC797_22390 [Chloroflexi bacterium]|nr:hypothetical protein [Chloroflexota bacterium]
MLDLQAGELLLERLVRLLEPRVFVLEHGAAHALRRDVLLVAFEAPIGVGQTILEDAFEAGFGVALMALPALLMFESAFTAAEAVLEQQTGDGQGGGDDGAAAERVPEEIGIHG